MYSMEEIKYQNRMDCFSNLFYILGKNLLTVLGRRGEEVIRTSVLKWGKGLGSSMKEELEDKEVKANLKGLIEKGELYFDPRFRLNPLRSTQQELWMEVHTCPFADFMKGKEAGNIGMMFCEEYCHGFFEGLSNKVAQINLSKLLTCEHDNHCRLSIYYRPANLAKDEREKVFDLDSLDVESEVDWKASLKNAQRLEEAYLKLFGAMYDEAKKAAGEEGLCAIAMGLRELGVEQAKEMGKWAKARNMELDEDFIKDNYPVNCDAAQSGKLNFLDEEKSSFYYENFYSVFTRYIFG